MVDIILTYWDTDILIDKCIFDIQKTNYNDYHIWIIDNTRTSKSELNSKFASQKITILDGPVCRRNTGHSRGRQHPLGIVHGIQSTCGEHIVLIEADCWPLKPEWLSVCLSMLDDVKLVGLQDPYGLPITFQVFRRSLLGEFPEFSYLRKEPFSLDEIKLLANPAVLPDRHKWRNGEQLGAKILLAKQKICGLVPTKSCVPLSWNINLVNWADSFDKTLGTIYGELVFHAYKSFRRSEQIKNNIDFYIDDLYLLETQVLVVGPKLIFNDGQYDNLIYRKNS